MHRFSAENPDSKLVLTLVNNGDAFYKHPTAANKPIAAQQQTLRNRQATLDSVGALQNFITPANGY